MLAIVAGLLWFAPVWEGWAGWTGAGPHAGHAGGELCVPRPRPPRRCGEPFAVRGRRALVVATYVLVGLVRRSASCSSAIRTSTRTAGRTAPTTCSTSVQSPTSPAGCMRLQSWITTGCAAALAALCVARLVGAFTVGPRRHWEVLPGGVASRSGDHRLWHRLAPPAVGGSGPRRLRHRVRLRCSAVVLISARVGGDFADRPAAAALRRQDRRHARRGAAGRRPRRGLGQSGR